MSLLSLPRAFASTEPRSATDAEREVVVLGQIPHGTGQAVLARSSSAAAKIRESLLCRCAYEGCRSGWVHLWRNRSAPMFESGWTCSSACTGARVQAAIRREMQGRKGHFELHRHRIPLGLLMMEQGWITPAQLRRALDAQKAAGSGRLGEWLVRQRAVSEARVTRALAMQWSCPVLLAEAHDAGQMTAVMPRLFVDAFGGLPLRQAGERLLYLGFEQSPDRILALALERMLGLRLECGIVPASEFRTAQANMLRAVFPPVELVEAAGEVPAARIMGRALEKARPVASRLVRVHDLLWLRLWLRPQTTPLAEPGTVRDLVCSIGRIG